MTSSRTISAWLPGPRPTRPACRCSPAWSAMTKLSRARSGMRSSSPSPQTQRAYVWPARHYASSLTGAQYPPMGVRFRLRANFDISGYSPVNQIILRALKKYGMMIIDNGAPWFLSGAPDARWDNSDLHNLGRIHGSDFEAGDVSGLMISADSGQARQAADTPVPPPPVAISVSLSPTRASVRINRTRAFTATVQNASNQAVTWKVNGITGGKLPNRLYQQSGHLPGSVGSAARRGRDRQRGQCCRPCESARALVTLVKQEGPSRGLPGPLRRAACG